MDVITSSIFENKDRLIVVADGWTVSCADVVAESLPIAEALTAHGLKKGDSVMITLPLGRDRVIAEMACALGGFLYISEHSRDVDALYDGIGTKMLIDEDTFPALGNRFARAPLVHPEPGDAFSIGRSGGTSGRGCLPNGTSWYAKTSIRTRRDVVEKRRLMADMSGVGPEDTCMFVNYGTAGYHPDTLIGAACGITGPVVFHDLADRFWEEGYMERLVATFDLLRPTAVWYMCMKDRPERSGQELLDLAAGMIGDGLKRLVVSGPLSEEVIREVDSLLPETTVVRSFGQNEIRVRLQCEIGDPLEKRLTTWGRLQRYGKKVKLAKDGELLLYKDLTYDIVYGSDDRLSGNWHKTGDLWTRDSDGYYVFLRRK